MISKYTRVCYNNGAQGIGGLFLIGLKGIYSNVDSSTPVIDMSESAYYCEQFDNPNIWENYFKQVDISLNELKELAQDNVTVVNESFSEPYIKRFTSKAYDYLKDTYEKYVSFTDDIEKEFSESLQAIAGKKCLAVCGRGTDYLYANPERHAIMPEPYFLLEEAERFVNEHGYTHVFLTTEDQHIFDMFKSKFNEKLIAVDMHRVTRLEVLKAGTICNIPMDMVAFTKAYLKSIFLMSRCDGFIGGSNGSALASIVMRGNKEFGDLNIYYLGNIRNYRKYNIYTGEGDN